MAYILYLLVCQLVRNEQARSKISKTKMKMKEEGLGLEEDHVSLELGPYLVGDLLLQMME